MTASRSIVLLVLLLAACSAPADNLHASRAALPAQQILVLERDEVPSDVVRRACAASVLDVVESIGTAEAGRVAAVGAPGVEVQASWEVASSPEGESWIVLVSGSDRDVLRRFIAALHAAR